MSTRRLTTVSCDTPIEQVVEIIRRDGAVAICNFVSEETLKSLTEDLDSYLGVTPCGMDPYFAGTQTRRTARILAKSDSAVEVALNPLFLETAKQVLQTPTHVWVGNDRVEITPDIQLSMTQAIQIGPGQGLQPLHRDDATSLWRHPQYGREARLQLMLAITDFTEENGATRVIPGSHQWDDERMPTQEEAPKSRGDKTSSGINLDFSLTYDGTLLPGWQVTPGVFYARSLGGRTPNLSATFTEDASSMNLYLNFVRNPASWQISLNYAKFMGGETPYDQLYRDRDYVGIAISRTL